MTIRSGTQGQAEAKQYRLALLRDSASTVVEYVTSLQSEQLQEFWLPCKLCSFPFSKLT